MSSDFVDRECIEKKLSAAKIFEVICIGRELLDGRVLDTNSHYIAQELKTLGHRLQFAQKVDDDPKRMKQSFEFASDRSDVVFVTGGLGPTSDDRSAEVFSQLAGREFKLNEKAADIVKDFLARKNSDWNEEQAKQAKMPEGSWALNNFLGTAPGFVCLFNGTLFVFMPGVPVEMKAMFQSLILDYFSSKSGTELQKTWVTQFTRESELEKRLREFSSTLPREFELSFRTRFPENHVSLHGPSGSVKDFEDYCKKLGQFFSDEELICDEKDYTSIEKLLVDRLSESLGQLMTAESCTSGELAARVGAIAGVSSIYRGSWVVYSNSMKEELGVPGEIINTHGAVSEECARELALSLWCRSRKHCANESKNLLSLCTTGIAGPGGGSKEKPVGLCYAAVAYGDRLKKEPEKIQVQRILNPKNWERAKQQRAFADRAFKLALDCFT